MPKNEFDFEDPFELTGMALLTHEDTTDTMAECFVEEFLRIGYNAKQVLALFQNPHYIGPNLALQKRGEPFVRALIVDVFARWGRPVAWQDPYRGRPEEVQMAPAALHEAEEHGILDSASTMEMDGSLTDPLGTPIPKLNL